MKTKIYAFLPVLLLLIAAGAKAQTLNGEQVRFYTEEDYDWYVKPVQHTFRFTYSSVTPLTLTTGGQVGIGTNAPNAKLHVIGDSYLQGKVYIGNMDTYFYRDAANRIKTNDMFYVGTSSPATYLYSTNTYLGATSGDNIHLRGNTFKWTSGGGGIINSSGNVGIGTSSPSAKLEVESTGASYNGTPSLLVQDKTNRGTLFLESVADQPTDFVFKNNGVGRVWLSSRHGSENYSFTIWTNPDGSGSPEKLALRLSQNGNMALYGKFEATEIRVRTSPSADFVFETDYKLRSLEEVDAFIKENHHLPEIASAEEMESEGLNVSEFQIQLLQKIEELTLYMIELKAENEEQARMLNELMNK